MSDLENKHRLKEIIKKDPTPVIGLAGLAGVVGYSIYHYRKKSPDMKPSVYVIQTRVIAQGIVVGALTVSLAYRMYQKIKEPHIVPDSVNLVTPTEIKKIKEN